MHKRIQKILSPGTQVKILKCETNDVPIGTFGTIESYLPNYAGYGVNVKGRIVFVNENDIDDDPQISLNV